MLHLNLLSAEAKQEIKLKRIYSLVKWVSFLLIIFTAILAIIFVSAKQVFYTTYKSFIEEDPLIKTNGQNYSAEIKAINEKLTFVSQIQNEFISYSRFLKELSGKIPDGVSLSYIKVDTDRAMLKMKGRAEKRDDLLSLKDRLSESPIFSEIDFPLKNILKKDNIDFELNIKLDLSQIPKP